MRMPDCLLYPVPPELVQEITMKKRMLDLCDRVTKVNQAIAAIESRQVGILTKNE